MRTRLSIAIACSRQASSLNPRCSFRPSNNWRPMVSAGLSDDIGSWNTMPTSDPRTARICAGVKPVSSRESSRMAPAALRTPGGNRLRMAFAARVLPLPDSPTMARHSLASTYEGEVVDKGARLAMLRCRFEPQMIDFEQVRGLHASLRGIEPVAQRVAKEVDAQQGKRDAQAGHNAEPRGMLHVGS